MTSSQETIERLVTEYAQVWAKPHPDEILKYFTEDAVYEDVTLGAVNTGKEAIRAFLTEFLAAVPDIHMEFTSTFATERGGGAEWVMTGTQTGDMPGIPATGKRVSLRGASILELRDGRISRQADYWNMVSLLQQLGLMPEEAPAS